VGAYGLQPAGCATCFGASYAFAENPVRALGIASMPLALFMLSYPGVLLSTTSIPIWSRTRWLGALLGTSSMASAARALSLMAPHSAAVKRLEQVSHAAEALALSAYVATAGPAASALTKGRFSRMFLAGPFVAGIVAPAVINMVQRKPNRTAAMLFRSADAGGRFGAEVVYRSCRARLRRRSTCGGGRERLACQRPGTGLKFRASKTWKSSPGPAISSTRATCIAGPCIYDTRIE